MIDGANTKFGVRAWRIIEVVRDGKKDLAVEFDNQHDNRKTVLTEQQIIDMVCNAEILNLEEEEKAFKKLHEEKIRLGYAKNKALNRSKVVLGL